MIQDIKKKLLENPDSIVNILAHYDFEKITIRNSEIRCARDIDGNSTSIRIKLQNNDGIYVTDFARDISCDLFDFIMKSRNVKFIDVLNVIKQELGIDSFEYCFKPKTAFGGFYNKIKNKNFCADTNKVYSVETLNQYENIPNLRFINDNIPIDIQKKFNIRFDVESQRIIIPIFNVFGELVGIKGRANWDTKEDESKYMYLIPCSVSNTLYGYYLNYSYLKNNVVYLFESEKSVMQTNGYRIFNCLALGGNTISQMQCKLLLELNPTSIVFMFDENLDFEIILKNVEKLKNYCRMKEIMFKYWKWDLSCKTKNSPSDYGKDRFLKIIESELIDIE